MNLKYANDNTTNNSISNRDRLRMVVNPQAEEIIKENI